MKLVNTVAGLVIELDLLRDQELSIGFVPTMGALHKGHLSLIEIAAAQNDAVVVSIFVNPTQFNNPDDLRNYPRDLESDLEILKSTNCQIVFSPGEDEIYPDENSKKRNFDFGHLGRIMEGKYRPGHFNGVANVVKRLFEIVKPAKAYFGQKDIQQFQIIQYLTRNYLSNLAIQLVKCPIIREKDGLAMSSRNVLLTDEQRRSAVLISKSLFNAKEIFNQYEPEKLKYKIIGELNADPNLEVEYLEIVNDTDLKVIGRWDDAEKILACIAVKVGNVRLIDNIYFN